MGAIADKFESNSIYQRKMDEVELEKLRKLAELDAKKDEKNYKLEQEKLEIEKAKALSQSELRKAELILQFQTDIRKIEAELLQTRLKTQSDLFGKFVEFMYGTMTTNSTLIEQRTVLYNLIEKSTDQTKVDYFMAKANEIKIADAKDLINVGLEKVKELNIESSNELHYLESRLEIVLGINDNNNRQLLNFQTSRR